MHAWKHVRTHARTRARTRTHVQARTHTRTHAYVHSIIMFNQVILLSVDHTIYGQYIVAIVIIVASNYQNVGVTSLQFVRIASLHRPSVYRSGD